MGGLCSLFFRVGVIALLLFLNVPPFTIFIDTLFAFTLFAINQMLIYLFISSPAHPLDHTEGQTASHIVS